MDDVIDLHLLKKMQLIEVAKELSDYKKMQSFIVLKAIGFPTLDGIIVTDWRKGTKKKIKDALASRGWADAMIRSDKSKQVYLKPRGGNLYSEKNIYSEIRSAIKDQRIVSVLEPASRFDDLYSGNIIFNPSDDYLYWEIVGPGFDMGDINRGDNNPHERFRTSRGKDVEDWGQLSPWDVRGRNIISEAEYRISWETRLIKVGMMAPAKYEYIENPFERAKVFLKESNHTLLLESQSGYRPMGYEMRCKIYRLVADLPEKIEQHGFHGEPFVVSFGVLNSRGLIFWDIFYPHTYCGEFQEHNP